MPQSPPLVSVLSDLVDPRKRRYPLTALVAAGIAATLSGARSFAAIAQWLTGQDEAVATVLGFDPRRRAPEKSVSGH